MTGGDGHGTYALGQFVSRGESVVSAGSRREEFSGNQKLFGLEVLAQIFRHTTMSAPQTSAKGGKGSTVDAGKEEHHHHHHHHHQNIHSTLTGQGSEAPGRRVLVGVDDSEHSNYALEWYLDNVWHRDDYVVLLNCPETDDPMRHHAFQFDREKLMSMMKEEQDELHKVLEKYREKLLDIGAHGKVRAVATKHVGHALVRVQEEEDAEFIVMGSRGKGTIRRTFMGSVSDYVVHHSTVPVLVCRIRQQPHSRRISKTSPNK